MKRRIFAFSLLLSMLLCIFPGQTAFAAAAPTVTRYAGQDRFETSRKISGAVNSFVDSKYIVIANGMNFPDALAGVPFAAAKEAPILLTDGKTLDSGTRGEINKISPETVYILGGELAVSKDIENTLSASCKVERVFGQDRYGTALAIAENVVSGGDVSPSNAGTGEKAAFICSGENFPDALSVSSVAGILGSPVLFSNFAGEIKPESLAYLKSAHEITKIYIIGGEYAVGKSAADTLTNAGFEVERVYGQNRYDTSAAIYKRFSEVFESTDAFSFASGENFPDALTGSVYSALMKMPLLLLSNELTNTEVERETSGNVSRAYVYGGPYAVTELTLKYLFDGDFSTPAPIQNGAKITAALNASGYATVDTGSAKVASFTKGKDYNCIDTHVDNAGVTWFLIQLCRDQKAWVRRQDILGQPVVPEQTGKAHATVSVTSATVGEVQKGKTYFYSDKKTFGEETWYLIQMDNGGNAWVRELDIFPLPPYNNAAINNYISSVARNYGAIGVQVALIDNGKVTSAYNYGWATKNSEAMKTSTKIRVASISKVAIAVNAMKLQEQGKLNITQNIGKYWNVGIPKPVTMKSLLTHTSTLRQMTNSSTASGTRSQIASSSAYTGGTVGSGGVWAYNNYAVGVAGATLEMAAGENLDTFARAYVFGPLGMDAAFMSGHVSDKKNIATLYYNGGGVARSKTTSINNTGNGAPGSNAPFFAGGLTASAKDVAKMFAMLANDGVYNGTRILSAESVAAIERVSFNTGEHGGSFGQAMPLRYKPGYFGESRLYYHTANAYGVLGLASYNPDTGDGVIVITTGASAGRDSQGVYGVCSSISNYIYRNVI